MALLGLVGIAYVLVSRGMRAIWIVSRLLVAVLVAALALALASTVR